jgi:hypothetical protein
VFATAKTSWSLGKESVYGRPVSGPEELKLGQYRIIGSMKVGDCRYVVLVCPSCDSDDNNPIAFLDSEPPRGQILLIQKGDPNNHFSSMKIQYLNPS